MINKHVGIIPVFVGRVARRESSVPEEQPRSHVETDSI